MSSSNKEQKRLPINFGIRFGIIAPNIGKQIKEHGLKYDPATVRRFDEQKEAINTLLFGSMIVETQAEKLFKKLYNKILRHVGKENDCNVKP